MVIAINPGETREYVVPQDEGLPESEQTVWTLRILDQRQSTAIQDASVDMVTGAIRLGTMQQLTLAYGLVDVRNFKDVAGADISMSFTRGAHGQIVADGFLARIPQGVRATLAEEINRANQLNAIDRKN